MSRRHKHKPDSADGSAGRFRSIKDELLAATELPVTPANVLRIEQAVWLKMAQQNLQTAILLGKPVMAAELQPFTKMLNSILPAATTLTIKFVDQYTCNRCKAELPPPEATPEKAAEVEEPAPLATVAPATPAPTNVTPLRSIHDHVAAPLASRRDEPWRASTGSEFRRFDVPEDF
jgi:hypothetical protein